LNREWDRPYSFGSRIAFQFVTLASKLGARRSAPIMPFAQLISRGNHADLRVELEISS
jgi:hypothetical protein